MVIGECNCGSVAFEGAGDIYNLYMCHCSDSRRSTGIHGIAVVLVSNKVFRWLRGEVYITTWKKSVEDWGTSFCRICGSKSSRY